MQASNRARPRPTRASVGRSRDADHGRALIFAIWTATLQAAAVPTRKSPRPLAAGPSRRRRNAVMPRSEHTEHARSSTFRADRDRRERGWPDTTQYCCTSRCMTHASGLLGRLLVSTTTPTAVRRTGSGDRAAACSCRARDPTRESRIDADVGDSRSRLTLPSSGTGETSRSVSEHARSHPDRSLASTDGDDTERTSRTTVTQTTHCHPSLLPPHARVTLTSSTSHAESCGSRVDRQIPTAK